MHYLLYLAIGDVSVQKRGWGSYHDRYLRGDLGSSENMRIMYKANLNFARFNKYFSDFLKRALSRDTGSDGKVCYRISQRGKTLLTTLKKASELALSDEL